MLSFLNIYTYLVILPYVFNLSLLPVQTLFLANCSFNPSVEFFGSWSNYAKKFKYLELFYLHSDLFLIASDTETFKKVFNIWISIFDLFFLFIFCLSIQENIIAFITLAKMFSGYISILISLKYYLPYIEVMLFRVHTSLS